MLRALMVAGVVTTVLALPVPVASAEPSGEPTETSSEVAADADTSPCGGGWGLGGGLCHAVSGAIGYGVGSAVSAGADLVLDRAVDFVVEGADWLLGRVVAMIDSSTRPDLTSQWFAASYRDMALVAGLTLLPFLLLAIIQAVVRQDASMLLRAAFVSVPVAAIGTGAAVMIVDALVQVTDLMTSWIGRTLGSDLTTFATGVSSALIGLDNMAVGTVAPLASLLGAAVIAFAAFVVWIELLLRQAAIYVAVLFLPLGFVALVWPATSHWMKRLIDALVAVILSKFVIVAVMALGAGALSADVPSEGYGTVIGGGAMLSLAALAPYVLLRFIPVFNAGLSAQFEGAARRPTAAVAAPVPSGRRVLDAVRQRAQSGTGPVVGRAGGGPPTPGRAPSVPAPAVAERIEPADATAQRIHPSAHRTEQPHGR